MSTFQNEFAQPIGAPITNWKGATPPSRITLEGRYCHLIPVNPAAHLDDLAEAYDTAADGRDWTYLATGPFSSREAYRAHLEKLASTSDPLHFAVVDTASGQALGTLALMRIDPANGVIEVGFIAFSPLLKKTRVATEAIFLLMRHVFDDLGYRRFEWKCDSLNAPSRAAAKRFGFTFEGIFRQAIVYRSRNRDTAWFSIIDLEWPALKSQYERWLDPKNFDADGKQIERLSNAAERSMTNTVHIRPVEQTDYAAWEPLWDGYNAFYGRAKETALPQEITDATWARFLDANEPVHALVAEQDGKLIGLVHFIYHRSTTLLGPICYLQDLFTAEAVRGHGVGRMLINGVYASAKSAGSERVYWHTHETNATAMKLYDKVADKPGFVMYRQAV